MAKVYRGFLHSGKTDFVEVLLQGGRWHSIFVDAEEPNVDFDLYVYDEHGQEVDQDTSRNPDAQCMVRPVWTGPFMIKIKSAKGVSRYMLRIEY